jgi:predicted SAM-dependent methyltransferase
MKLNLGSGRSGLAALNVISLDHIGWKSIDICKDFDTNNGFFECYDISQGIRESDNSIEEIWMGDFFEHLLRLKAIFVMQECHRVLQPNGRLRLSVPDMAKAMPLWLASEGEAQYQYSRLIWGEQDEMHQQNSIPDSHFYGYTEKSLKKLISSVGFNKVDRISIHNVWFELAIDAHK